MPEKCIYSILDAEATIVVHRNINCNPAEFLKTIAPYRENLVVGVECMFSWYWLYDLCLKEKIEFTLGHALYMKAIHGGKAKTDKIDSHKIAVLLRGGTFPIAYCYPAEMRATRDLMRRRSYLVRTRAELMAHIQNTITQYNLPAINFTLAYESNRNQVLELFSDTEARKIVQLDIDMIGSYDDVIRKLELDIEKTANKHDKHSLLLLRSIQGV